MWMSPSLCASIMHLGPCTPAPNGRKDYHAPHIHSMTMGRRGAAHGLAGAVKGLNIRALNEYGILDALKKGLDDKVRLQAFDHTAWL